MSETVGVGSLYCLYLLSKENPNMTQVQEIIKRLIIPSATICYKERGIVYGTAGYLYALLLIYKKLKGKCEDK